MAIIRKSKSSKSETASSRGLESVVSSSFNCNLLCELCERFFDCSKPEKERIYSRRRMEKAREALSKIRHKILVAGGKGGVGKSTCSTNLAIGLAVQKYRTTILDQDLDGSSIPKMLGVMEKKMDIGENGLIPVEGPLGIQVVAMANLVQKERAVVWFHDMRRNASEEFIAHTSYGERDFLVVDLPPGTSSDVVSVLQLIPDADGMVVVAVPSRVSQATARKAILLGKKAGIRLLGVIENMSGYVCECCGFVDDVFPVGGGYDLAKEQDIPFLGRIPIDGKLARSCDSGKPFVEAFGESATAKSIESITKGILHQISTDRPYGFQEWENQQEGGQF